MSVVEGVIHSHGVYVPGKSSILSEEHYESQLVQHVTKWLTDWLVVPFKKRVFSEVYGRAAIPDLAIIHKQLRAWYIVEVELTAHSLRSHVIPQILTLKDAYYGPDHADYLLRTHLPEMRSSAAEFRRLVTNLQPEIYVVAESEAPGWRAAIEQEGCRFMLFQPFVDDRGRWCYRFRGPAPTVERRLISYCAPARQFHMMKCLELENVDAISSMPLGEFRATVDGVPHRWKCVRVEGAAFLMVMGRMSVDLSESRWTLWISDGHLSLEPAARSSSGGVR